MGNSVNKVILVGRLGKNPEIRSTPDGKSVANISLATDESYKDRTGEKQKKVEWHNLVVWGASVDNFVQPYLHKGDMVYAEGKLQTRTWKDKEGNAKYTTEVNITDIKGLVTGDGGQQQQSSKPAAKPASRQIQQEVEDESIPF